MPRVAAVLFFALVGGCASRPPAPHAPVAREPSPETPVETASTAEPAQGDPRWLDQQGTSIVGFGILRVVPPPGGGRFSIRYRERAYGYSVADTLQLFVLPADSFALRPNAFAGQFLAFDRHATDGADDRPDALVGGIGGGMVAKGSSGYGGDYGEYLELSVEFAASSETTVLVGYGPWTGPDVGRPPGDEPTFHLEVVALPGDDGRSGAHEWVESEAGELITTNWSRRPEVERGAPVRDPRTGADLHLEIRPLVIYDPRLVRGTDEPDHHGAAGTPSPQELRAEADAFDAAGRPALAQDRRERARDLELVAPRRDGRVLLTPALAEKFRRVPIRWR